MCSFLGGTLTNVKYFIMKIIAGTKAFTKSLNIGGHFAGKSNINPYAGCVKITTKNNRIKIESTDMQNSIRKFDEVIECNADGTFCVAYSDLYSYLSAISSPQVELNHLESEKKLEIKHESGIFCLPTIDTEGYPSFPLNKDKELPTIRIDHSLFEGWIAKAQNFAGHDELRPIMSSMYVYIKDGRIGYCATDSHVLITDQAEYEDKEDDRFVVIDVASLKAVQSVLKSEKSNKPVEIEIDDKSAFVKVGQSTVRCRLLEGNYPNFRAVIPANNNIETRVKKEDLLDALRRASMGTPTTGLCRLNIQEKTMRITMEDLDRAQKGEETLAVASNGQIEIGVNFQKLATALLAIDGDEVILKLSEPNRAFLLNEVEPTAQKVILVMPMMM